jgi:GH15 family glucan-1,4-alpha-glucosidase
MSNPIEDYGLIGDCHTAALVSREGSIDWLCLPRFDAGACFAALMGGPEHGRWQIKPLAPIRQIRRSYWKDTLLLDTEFDTDDGTVVLTDCMALRSETPRVIRRVRGKTGKVTITTELIIRFDYGTVVPWVRKSAGGLTAVAGPDLLFLQTEVPLKGRGLSTVGEFTLTAGEEVYFTLSWHPSHVESLPIVEVHRVLETTAERWIHWSARCNYKGPWREAVLRSLITLKALTYYPTGGVVASPTTSLPEKIGGPRNWDYRYCWLRDATFSLYALMIAGYREEARAWRDWLRRAAAGSPSDLQIMYGLGGERRLTEWEVSWLPGYEGSTPVRVGNAASRQFQLDVYGEVMDAMYQCHRVGLNADGSEWNLEVALMKFLETVWEQPDEGIWEVRGPRQPFTHSKVMAWVAVDRAVKMVEQFGAKGPLDRWRALREKIHQQVCEQALDPKRGVFVQCYGGRELDASVLMLSLVGFLPPTDERIVATVKAIEKELMYKGFVLRYQTESGVDGLPPGEGTFIPCTLWLADNLTLMGRRDEAVELFERVLSVRNDLGLLAEEYDPNARRLLGNFPQAFSHVGLINTAVNLSRAVGPAEHRKES